MQRKPIFSFFCLGHVWKWIAYSTDVDGKSQLFNMLLKSVIFLKTVTVRLVPGSPWWQDSCSGQFAGSISRLAFGNSQFISALIFVHKIVTGAPWMSAQVKPEGWIFAESKHRRGHSPDQANSFF